MFPRLSACGHKFNVSDFVQKHFVSATNVSQFAQPKKHHGQQVFATMCPRVQKPTSGLVWYTKQGCRDVMQVFCSSHELHVPRGNFLNFAHKWHASIFLSQRDDRRGQNTNQVMLCENALFSQITLYLKMEKM